MSLGLRVVLRLLFGLLFMSVMLFIPAGTWRFWQGWALMGAMFPVIAGSFAYLYRHDRPLVERRLRGREEIREQKNLIRLLRPLFFLAFLLPGFDYRMGWSRATLGAAPPWLSVMFDALVFGGLLLVFWVLRVNSYASRTIRVETGQEVISRGPYAFVRHPLYSGSLVMWLSIPIALGSYVTWPAFAMVAPFYVYRLLHEEKFLRGELPGYSEYCERTRFRLVPGVW